MSNEVFYVVKGTVLAQGKVLLTHNQVIRNQEQLHSVGITEPAEIQRLIKLGTLVPSTVETVVDVQKNKVMTAPQAIGNAAAIGTSTKAERVDDDALFNNDSSTALGYDQRYLDQKSDHELRETVKQAIPGMSEEHLSNMGRSQLEDILQSDRGKGSSSQAEHTLGGDITPAT